MVVASAHAAATDVLERLAVHRAAMAPLLFVPSAAPALSVLAAPPLDAAAARSLAASALLERLRGGGDQFGVETAKEGGHGIEIGGEGRPGGEIFAAKVLGVAAAAGVNNNKNVLSHAEANARAVVRALAAARDSSLCATAVTAAGIAALEPPAVVAAPPPREGEHDVLNLPSSPSRAPSLGGFSAPIRISLMAPAASATAAPLRAETTTQTTARPLLALAAQASSSSSSS